LRPTSQVNFDPLRLIFRLLFAAVTTSHTCIALDFYSNFADGVSQSPNASGVPAESTPVDVSYNKTLGGPDGLALALNLTGVVHGPNGTLITEKDTTTVGGADNYEKVHDSKTILSPSELSLNGGKNTFLDNKNSSAGCG
ncbi:hypothetical protein COCSUDRAFT_46969, partial [Coccomyxa subellipsoidea C-169]